VLARSVAFQVRSALFWVRSARLEQRSATFWVRLARLGQRSRWFGPRSALFQLILLPLGGGSLSLSLLAAEIRENRLGYAELAVTTVCQALLAGLDTLLVDELVIARLTLDGLVLFMA
jgi:hypothetical protein